MKLPCMNTSTSPLRRAFAVATFILSVLIVSAAQPSELGEPAGSVEVPAGFSKADVRDTIVAVLVGREWGVKDKTDDRVVGYLKHRSNEATVTLIFTETKVDLFCVGWEIDKKT